MGYERECVGCGRGFETDRFRQRTCDSCGVGHHPARTARRKYHHVTFVGVDGESVNRPDGSHDYIMLSVGDRTLFRDGRQLGFGEIMSFLWDEHRRQPLAVFVGFFLGYDFTQWERLLPEPVARSLITTAGIMARKSQRQTNRFPDPVVYEGWEFDTLNNRRWKMRPHRHVQSSYTDGCRNRTCDHVFDVPDVKPVDGELSWTVPVEPGAYSDQDVTWRTFADLVDSKAPDYLYICDTGSFWQTSFLNVINPKGWDIPVCSEEEYALVVAGKADRDLVVPDSVVSYATEMATYNRLENDLLARVTGRLHEGFVGGAISIRIGRNDWYGPGRAAQEWLNMLSDRAPLDAKTINETLPEWARDACQASYYGGWFEIPMHGHVGTVYEYDINSAYPHVIAGLPCLLHGRWSRGNGPDHPRGKYTLVHTEIRGSNPFLGAMPHRDKYGRIARPHHLSGWYWLDELEAAHTAGLVDTWSVDEWVCYDPCDCPPPFDPDDIGITKMYDLRTQVGKNSPQGKGLKLVYNSAYGKTAQSVGQPKYGMAFYASRITSGTRRSILHAIGTHPVGAGDVTMVATDGVYFRSPHDGLMLSSSLGDWERKVKHGLTLMMPGVYWDDDSRRALETGSSLTVKSRGVSGKDIAKVLTELDTQWWRMHAGLTTGPPINWPVVTIPVGFNVVSAKNALHRNAWTTAGSVSRTSTKTLSGDPTAKRHPTPYIANGVIRTWVYDEMTAVETVPYDKSFGWEQEALGGIMDGVPDDFEHWRDFLTNGVVPGV